MAATEELLRARASQSSILSMWAPASSTLTTGSLPPHKTHIIDINACIYTLSRALPENLSFVTVLDLRTYIYSHLRILTGRSESAPTQSWKLRLQVRRWHTYCAGGKAGEKAHLHKHTRANTHTNCACSIVIFVYLRVGVSVCFTLLLMKHRRTHTRTHTHTHT